MKAYEFGILLCALLVGKCYGSFETCDYNTPLAAGQTVSFKNQNWKYSYYAPLSSCRFYFKAPSQYEIVLTCSINIYQKVGGVCSTDILYVARDGDTQLRGSEYLCGTGTFKRVSLFNQLTVAHISTNTTSSTNSYNCTVTTQLQAQDCGWSTTTKVVNGVETAINEFTPQVLLYNKVKNDLVCSGTIIQFNMIVTACHCTNGMDATTLGVRVGEHDTSVTTETKYTADYTILQIIRHESYNPTTQENDIALIKLTTDILWSRGVGPACLPFKYSTTNFVGTYVQVPGWGTTSFGGPISTKLRKVSLQIIASTTCSSLWSPPMALKTSMTCVRNPPQDACNYDSGGSMYYLATRYYTLGFVSFGSSCGQSTPTVSMNIAYYINWIISKSPGITYKNI